MLQRDIVRLSFLPLVPSCDARPSQRRATSMKSMTVLGWHSAQLYNIVPCVWASCVYNTEAVSCLSIHRFDSEAQEAPPGGSYSMPCAPVVQRCCVQYAHDHIYVRAFMHTC